MVSEVFPCLSPSKRQEDFSGPQLAVTSTAARGIQRDQRHSTGWGNFLHESWQAVEEPGKKKIVVLLHALLTVPLPPPHLHPPRRRPTPKGGGSPPSTSQRTCKYSCGLCLLISALLFSQFGPQAVRTSKYLESVFFSLSNFEVNRKYKYFIYCNGENHKHSSSGILGAVLHQKKKYYSFN